jgi:drug/metabolite transporter (DMT)-like permease
MVAFAANSLLCRLALKHTDLDAASFTVVRIVSGAAMLWVVMRWQKLPSTVHGSWYGAIALFLYGATFSYAYLSLSAGTGALLLFGAVQVTMILAGFVAGERMDNRQCTGFVAALGGLVVLVFPGIESPTLAGSVLMLVSGISWGVYSLLGRGVGDPIAATAGNFLRAAPLSIILLLPALPWLRSDANGWLYAVLSGALTSGLGYVLWYRVLQELRAINAATIQLSVPVLAALGGVVLLDEAITPNLLIASVLILGGIWLVLYRIRSA